MRWSEFLSVLFPAARERVEEQRARVGVCPEVARLHQGEVTLRNRDEGGVMATLTLHRPFT